MDYSRYRISNITQYIRCPMAYYYSHVEGIPFVPSSIMYNGTIVHASAELNYSQKIDTTENLPLDYVLDYTSDTFETHPEAQTIEWETPKVKGNAKDSVIGMSKSYYEEIGQYVQPLHSEVTLEYQIGNIPMRGTIDIVENDSTLRDIKTSKMVKNENEVLKSLQLTSYLIAAIDNNLMPPTPTEDEYTVIYDNVISGNTKRKAYSIVLPTKRSLEDIELAKKTITTVVGLIEREVFYQNTTNLFCTPNACQYWDRCIGCGRDRAISLIL